MEFLVQETSGSVAIRPVVESCSERRTRIASLQEWANGIWQEE